MPEHLRDREDILQLVTFALGSEDYAVDILKVQEINRMTDIARVPKAPPFVEGVINLRGRVIPVVSLRKRFGLPEKQSDEKSRIIVMDVRGVIVGLMVDSVSEVLRIPPSTVEEAPNLNAEVATEFIQGIAKLDDRLIILIDMDALIEKSESTALVEAAADGRDVKEE
ncbi:MAG: chemotaxis protein CheW [Nitrospirota bacterium]|jgi:purine-binding chemotaxis protein CheW